MIDDDFNKIVRDMFERLLNGTMGATPDMGSMGFTQGRIVPRSEPEATGTKVEEIDLGSIYLVVVETSEKDFEPVAEVKGRILEINASPFTYEPVRVTLDFDVDIAESFISFVNGVIEVQLVKAVNGQSSKGLEGHLKRV
jgi:hypothetical protein